MRSRAPLSPRPVPLQALVEAAEVELSTAGVDTALLRVLADPAAGDGPELSWMDLDGAHPLELLLRLSAPLHWRAVGVCCRGWAHPLDARGRSRRGPGSPAVTVTLMVDRTGESAGLLRQGETVTPLPGHPEGVIADACRRVLGLPTAPPPPSTAELWTLYWLDRIVEEATRTAAGQPLRTWASVAALHPAAETSPPPGRDPTPTEHDADDRAAETPAPPHHHPTPTEPDTARAAETPAPPPHDPTPTEPDADTRATETAAPPGHDPTPEEVDAPAQAAGTTSPHGDPTPTEPDTARAAETAPPPGRYPTPPPHRDPTAGEVDALARAAVRWAAAWPWSRLRAEPAAFDVPWLDRTPALAAWMDDGMWARWLLSALPQVDDLRAAVHDLLCERLAAAVDEVVTASCGGSGPC